MGASCTYTLLEQKQKFSANPAGRGGARYYGNSLSWRLREELAESVLNAGTYRRTVEGPVVDDADGA
jgi:hypothetical protein